MMDVYFVVILGACLYFYLWWAFRTLPQDGWQILAVIPFSKIDSDTWEGVNVTFYGLFIGISFSLANALLVVLLGATNASLSHIAFLELLILIVCLPSARWVARIVERKKHTFSIAGASFVAVLLAPLLMYAANRLAYSPEKQAMLLTPTLAALSIAYTIGEGLGRVACISFGCCYGKPLTSLHPVLQKLFRSHYFVFTGKTKKVCYEGHLEAEKVVPVQALTSIFLVLVGLVCILLFLKGYYAASFVLSLSLTQVWRVVSETLRADWRGDGRVSGYQIMAMISVLVGLSYLLFQPPVPIPEPVLSQGFILLWHPFSIALVLLGGILAFIYTGRSAVTASHLTFYVVEKNV